MMLSSWPPCAVWVLFTLLLGCWESERREGLTLWNQPPFSTFMWVLEIEFWSSGLYSWAPTIVFKTEPVSPGILPGAGITNYCHHTAADSHIHQASTPGPHACMASISDWSTPQALLSITLRIFYTDTIIYIWHGVSLFFPTSILSTCSLNSKHSTWFPISLHKIMFFSTVKMAK